MRNPRITQQNILHNPRIAQQSVLCNPRIARIFCTILGLRSRILCTILGLRRDAVEVKTSVIVLPQYNVCSAFLAQSITTAAFVLHLLVKNYLVVISDNLGQVVVKHLSPLNHCRGVQRPLTLPFLHTSILGDTLDRQLVLLVPAAVVDPRDVLLLAKGESSWVDGLHLGQIMLLKVPEKEDSERTVVGEVAWGRD